VRALGLLLAVASAAALAPHIARAERVPWDQVAPLPAAPAPSKAKAAPKRIPGREHVPDVATERVPLDKTDLRKVVNVVVASDGHAKAHAATGSMPGRPGVCLNGHGSTRMLQLEMDDRRGADAVQPLHIERLSTDTDGATLEATEAFIDLRTLGSRAVSTTTTRFSKVAFGPSGMRVFAARQTDGRVQIVVTGVPTPPGLHGDTAVGDGLPVLVTSLVSASAAPIDHQQSECGYVHFTLATKEAPGEMATISTPAPPSPVKRDPDDESDPNAQAARQARTISAVVSLSQLPSEPAPLLSVSFAVTLP
jgi:hypothetical protein